MTQSNKAAILERIDENINREQENYDEARELSGVNCCAACAADAAKGVYIESKTFIIALLHIIEKQQAALYCDEYHWNDCHHCDVFHTAKNTRTAVLTETTEALKRLGDWEIGRGMSLEEFFEKHKCTLTERRKCLEFIILMRALVRSP